MNTVPAKPVATHPWPDIVDGFARYRPSTLWPPYHAVEQLAGTIASGPLASRLFGLKSMHDLWVQQTDTSPLHTPYLRIAPLDTMVEFRYLDAWNSEKQWRRKVPPEAVQSRFEAFLDQLRWLG